MIIVRIYGGLGNQMFQYAAARRLAHKHNTMLKLDINDLVLAHGYSIYGLRSFNIRENPANLLDILRCYQAEGIRRIANRVVGCRLTAIVVNRLLKSNVQSLKQRYYDYDLASKETHRLLVGRILSQRFFHFDPEVLEAPDNVYLMGSWISEKYFKDIEDIIRNEFTVKTPQTGRNAETAEMIRNSQSVSLHVRRGDYGMTPEYREIYDICDPSYYERCVKYITDRVNSAHFFVFSDDIPWAKSNLKIPSPMTFVDHNNDLTNYEDLRLMSQCKHNIIANSSFSWWGAWLNANPGKIVCAPEKFIRLRNFDPKDILPEEWVKIPTE
ncbi:alpha-1,2-fucosyltransferase [Chloroflexota bacterium]